MGLEGTGLCLVLAAILIGLTQGDAVTQKVASVIGKEGGSVTMECHYDTSLSSYYLNWYREQQETQLQYVLQKYSGGYTDKADFAKKRFSIELQTSTKFSSLTISLLELSDSAVYYCWVCASVSLGRSSDCLLKSSNEAVCCPVELIPYCC
uniref:Ig-like domain-containing protein n=1 Tax=Callorhinchus milii TaxID=7868 RepID=A0A4W3H484_CALMI